MSNPQYSISGGVVFWSLGGGSDWQTLFDNMTAAGFGKECPDRVTVPEATKSALQDLYGEKRTLIRPLPNGNGYAVVDESASTAKTLEYNARIVAKWPMLVPPSPQNTTITGSGADWTEIPRIHAAVQAQLDVSPHHKVASGLVAVVKALGGVPLKPNGGIYWLPPRALAAWAKAAAAVESAGPGNQVFTARTAMDDDAIRAVVSAVRADIGTEIAALQEQAALNGDNKRSVKARQERAERLLARVTDYEQILGVTLGELRDGIEACQIVVVTAAATQMADDMSGMFENIDLGSMG